MASSRAYALVGSNLVSFDLANPTVGTSIPIGNLDAGETLVGIDFRPQNGMLYGLGFDAASGTGTLYAISVRTGWAGPIGTPGGIALSGAKFGFDFNPVVDRIRVVSDTGANIRINPNDGSSITDSAIAPGNAIAGVAYTNNQPNATVTTLYTLDALNDQLKIQNPANAGVQNVVGSTGATFVSVTDFDIPAGVNAATSGAVAPGFGYALLDANLSSTLYRIDLATGAATQVAPVLNGSSPTTGLAIQSDVGGIPAIALQAGGANLIRFNSATPGTTVTVPVSGVLGGEQLVAIDFRPQTGQLFGLGVNAAANTFTTYIVDPQNGAVAAVGASQTFPGDLPAGGYGFDFNASVDRLRITTETGLNFRINPDTGALIGPDTPINGLLPPFFADGVSAVAYTNSYGQAPGATVNTLYTLDAVGDRLSIQGFPNASPNSGSQGAQLTVTLNGSRLDFTGVNGFDIPPSVSVNTQHGMAAGFGYAALTVNGVTGLYKIGLTGGVATNLGTIGNGALQLAGLALADAPATGAVQSDFNGDGVSDVLWRHTSGQVAEWQINGAQIVTSLGVGLPDQSWRFQDTADFNGDSKSDVLWRHENGQVVLWTMDGAQIVANQSLPAIGNDWRNQGTADFDGDARADVLWRHDSGQVAIWKMNGAQITDNQSVAFVGNDWHVQGLADFNRDTQNDVLWRNDSGQVVIWTMNGAQIVANQSVATVGLDWNIAGTGDFDGDGRGDILWRNDSGQVVLWTMHGAQIRDNTSIAHVGLEWRIADVADYNHDGKSDVLLRHANGQVVMWEMNGAQITSNHTVFAVGGGNNPINLSWTVQNHQYDLL